MLLSLADQPWFDKMYKRLFVALSDRAQVMRARKAPAAIRYLENNQPTAIFVTDHGLTERKNAAVLKLVKDYVFNGGRLVIGGNFTNYVRPSKMGPFFRDTFNLPWESGTYNREVVSLNTAAAMMMYPSRELPSRYSQKALYARNVDAAAALYLHSYDDDGFGAAKPTVEAPAAWAPVGRGRVGFIGDVNAEEETDAVVLAMCGLKDSSPLKTNT